MKENDVRPMQPTTIESLKKILVAVVEIEFELEEVTPLTPLFDEGLGLDSFAVIDVIMEMEEHFGIEFSDADFLPDNFTNLSALGALVDRYLDQTNANVADSTLRNSELQ